MDDKALRWASHLEWINTLSAHIFETVLIPVDREFLTYLQGDGIFAGGQLPQSALSDDDDDFGNVDCENSSCDSLFDPSTLFPTVHKSILKTLRKFSGGCFPKLDGCSPKDAIWISTEHSLRCTSASDIYELFKASDRVALNSKNASNLVLKRWEPNWEPSMEFRIFVRHGKIIAGCQRDDTVFYEHLHTTRPTLVQSIDTFFSNVLVPQIVPKCATFVADLYLRPDNSTIVVDMGSWDPQESSPILFDWEELDSVKASESNFRWPLRLIESQSDCRLGLCRYNSIPIDIHESQT